MTEPTNAEIERAARVLAAARDSSTLPLAATVRALVNACDERDRAVAARDQAVKVDVAAVLANLPTLVRDTRRARRLSLRDAAEQIGVSFSVLSRVERGGDLMLSTAVALLRWVDQAPETR